MEITEYKTTINNTKACKMDTIGHTLSPLAEQYGFEIHPFKIGWYNSEVSHESFKLDLPYDTIAYIIISTPRMFDVGFKSYLRNHITDSSMDAIDSCSKYYFGLFMQQFPQNDIEAIYDFDLHANHRPKILVQTCAHVAGAARYYQRKDCPSDSWPPSRKIYGVSVHPKYGGWFAMRGVLIFKDLQCHDFKQPTPPNVLASIDQIYEVLTQFNTNWKDCTYRDVSPHIEERYSEEQITYFITPPKEREPLLEKIRQNLT